MYQAKTIFRAIAQFGILTGMVGFVAAEAFIIAHFVIKYW